MHYYMALTSRCNLECKYCHGKCVDDFMTFDEAKNYDLDIPVDTSVTIQNLIDYAKRDPEFILTFYGGEPLLKIELIKEIIDKVPAKEFMMQTNAVNLDKLPFEYVSKLSTILCSIDGTPEHTNERRGDGVYEKILRNVRLLREQGYSGHIIARMTVDETCDIYENVVHLFGLVEEGLFDGVHWQIDAQFWSGDYALRDFKKWSTQEYNPKLRKLVLWWLEKIKTTKNVPLLYPFTAVMQTLLTKVPVEGLRCGAGHKVLGLQTNKAISACPITAGFKPLYMGNIESSTPKQLVKNKIVADRQCSTCDIMWVCGGRCLYANKTQFWGENGFKEVCDTVYFLVDCLNEVKPEIEALIHKKELKLADFECPRYNGVEVIP